jgi:hypothetical protein
MRDAHARARARQAEEARIRREELGHLANDDDDDGDDVVVGGRKDEATTAVGGAGENDDEEGGGSGGEERDDPEQRQQPAMSEEDRERARAIAARFDTNREECRARRVEDREGLIERLRTRRLEIISSSGDDGGGDDDVGAGDRVAAAAAAAAAATALGQASATNADGKRKTGEEDGGMPRLTSTTFKTEDGREDPAMDGPSAAAKDNLGSSSEEEESDDDDDLEIVALPSTMSSGKFIPKGGFDKRKPSTVDLLFQHSSGNNKAVVRKDPQKASRHAVNPRAALQNALRVKFLNTGNRWLAR